MGGILVVFRQVVSVRLMSVWALVAVGAVIYAAEMYILVGPSIYHDAKKGIKAIINR